MKVMHRRHARIGLVIAFTGLFAASASAADSDARQRIFANEYVTVEHISLAPGEGLPAHAGAQRIVYSLSDYTIAWTEAGETQRKTWREGDVHAHEALEHAAENVGKTVAEFLIVARTAEPLAPAEIIADASQVEGGYAALLADFEGARVMRVALPPGVEQPMHDGKARLAYALNDHRLRFMTEDGGLQEITHLAGDVHWHDAGPHAVANVGESTARYVLFAFDQ